MANYCYNGVYIYGTEQMLDKFEKALNKATKVSTSLNKNTFYQVLGQEPVDGDVYETFGSRWFEPSWERTLPNKVTLCGCSAWTPISEFLLRLSAVYGFTIESTYEEGGDDFGGWYDCKNGEITRDESTSFYAFRYLDNREHAMESMTYDASEGCWESVDELCPELLEIMRSKDKAELIEAVNQSILDRA